MKKLFVYFLFIAITIQACTKIKNNETDLHFIENAVNLDEANQIGTQILFPNQSNSAGIISDRSPRIIKDIYEFKNSKLQTSFYLINFQNPGFIILSADKRTLPILAYSSENNFSTPENIEPEGLKYWITTAQEQISQIQTSNILQSLREKIAWKNINYSFSSKKDHNNLLPPTEDCYEHEEWYVSGPLLTTAWHQEADFNSELPFIICNDFNKRVYAGCVPIAIAQVMNYHQYPSAYNWSAMPLTTANSTTAAFIKDIHVAINDLYPTEPSYTCFGTGVLSSADMSDVFKLKFGYYSAISDDYDWNTVK